MTKQIRVPAVILRGGTSKGIYLKENDLPRDKKERDAYILSIFGSPDRRQIDGLAGADPLTSKVAIIGPSSHPDADIDYTFGQVAIDRPYIDYSGNCGNISSGVGPFAIEESLVKAKEPRTTVRIHNTNTGKILVADVEVEDGQPVYEGDTGIDGVPGTGSTIWMDFSGTAGSTTGRILPTGNPVDVIETSRGPIEVSIVDVANVCVFVRAQDVNMQGTESPTLIDGNPDLLSILEEIRAKATVLIGLETTEEAATQNLPAFPMVCFVNEAQDYTAFGSNQQILESDIDFLARLMFMQVTHKTYAGTATACTGAAARIKGTIVNQVCRNRATDEPLRIGHPSGIITVLADADEQQVRQAAFQRTARHIMKGYVAISPAKVDELMKQDRLS